MLYGAERTKNILKYMRGWIWASHVLLILSSVWMRGGGFFPISLVLFLVSLWIKGRNLIRILKGIEGKYMRFPVLMCVIYLAAIGFPAALKHQVSFVMYLVPTLLFLLGAVSLALKRGNQCMTVLEQFYPWIAGDYYKDFPFFDHEERQKRVASLDEELNELYQNTPVPAVKEAILKKETAGVIWVLMFESILLGMFMMAVWCES